ncbi:hypothetical protein ACLI1C_04475 [Devosia sp. XGJD_8]|uniref:hypothetical protein n=1 Tax=Devosia sp. XGJD_8 TaxID=3391187 RepID=UPI003984C4BE
MIRHLWPLLAGFTLWALAFILLYAMQYLGCYFGWAPAAHRTALVVGYVMSLAALAGALLVQLALLRRRGAAATSFDRIGIGATIAALAATAVTFGPTLLASACI